MTTPSAGALRAASWICAGTPSLCGENERIARIIDAHTNHAALVEAAKEAFAAMGGIGLQLTPNSPDWQEPLMSAYAKLKAELSKEGA